MIKTLGSIKNVTEALIITNSSFDIIDLKNINDGALGYIGDSCVQEITSIIKNKSLSVTAGNQKHPDTMIMEKRLYLLNKLGIEYIKIGIFDLNLLKEHEDFLKKTQDYHIKKVGVLFADQDITIDQIQDVCALNYDGLMIDTINKNNLSTLDILSENKIRSFINYCNKFNKFCGISGSITSEKVEYAMKFKPNFIGFRGALCSDSKRNNINANQCDSLLSHVKDISEKMYQEAV